MRWGALKWVRDRSGLASVADFESEFGEITADEIAAQKRLDRQEATVVRGQRRPAGRKAKSA